MIPQSGSKGAMGQFNLQWDDDHVVPPLMYPDLAFLFHQMNHVTVEEVDAREGERILDIGCGRAIDTVELAKRKGQCLGLELSDRMISRARDYVAESGVAVTLVRGMGEQLPFKDDSFDKVMCKGALDHFPDPEKAIEEIARVLKPQGTAVITVANFESLGFRLGKRLFWLISVVDRNDSDDQRVWHVPHDHVYKFDYKFLRKLIEPHLGIDRAIGISLLFGFPWWGSLLARLPQTVRAAALHALDKLARRLPSLSDTMLLKCSPRNGVKTD